MQLISPYSTLAYRKPTETLYVASDSWAKNGINPQVFPADEGGFVQQVILWFPYNSREEQKTDNGKPTG